MKAISLFLFFSLSLTLAFSQETSVDAFNQANELFENGDFKAAQKAYYQIIDKQKTNAQLHYNLAVAHYKNKELSKAILHAEKAKQLKPRDKQINHNLNYFRKQREELLDNTAYSFFNNTWNKVAGQFKSNVWAVLAVLLFWLFGFGIFVFILAEDAILKRVGFFLGIVILVLGLFSHFLGQHSKHLESGTGAAIFMDSEYALKSKPRNESEDLQIINNGEKLLIKNQLNDWYKVKLLNGQQGWIHKEQIELI